MDNKTVSDLEKENTCLHNELTQKVDYIHELVEVKEDYKHKIAVLERALKRMASNVVCLSDINEYVAKEIKKAEQEMKGEKDETHND